MGRAAELAAAPDEGALEQAVILQVRKQRRQALVQLRALPAHGGEVVAVRVPAAGVVDDDVGDARLDHPPRRQAVLPEGVAAVAVPQVRLLLGEIEHSLAWPRINS